jgi:hypothetical protein
VKKAKDQDIPTPPLPQYLREPEKETPALRPEDIRARLQLAAVKALDTLEWHMSNLGDAKSSEAACTEILDRAGYVVPGKGKGDPLAFVPGVSEEPPIPQIEDEVRRMSDAFAVGVKPGRKPL